LAKTFDLAKLDLSRYIQSISYWSSWRFSKGEERVGHLKHKFQWWCPFMRYQNIGSMFFCFVTKHACDRQTDRRTGGRTELRSPRPDYK